MPHIVQCKFEAIAERRYRCTVCGKTTTTARPVDPASIHSRCIGSDPMTLGEASPLPLDPPTPGEKPFAPRGCGGCGKRKASIK